MIEHREYDAVVIGGGPSGLIAAAELAQKGIMVLVLEEHPQIGLPDHCAGLVSISGFRRLGLDPSSESIQNLISGARLIAPNGTILEIGGKEDKAYVLNRYLFDRSLATAATKAGVQIELNTRVTRVLREGGGVLCETSAGRSYHCRLLVDSEGISCRILKTLGLTPPSSDWVFPAVQFEISGREFDADFVELYLGRDVAPGFFAWSIPMSENTSKIGLAAKGADPIEMLRGFRDRCFPASQVFSIRSGSVVLGGPAAKTFDENLLVVGDAAGQTKPTTGGGVVIGGLCAKLAGSVGANALLEGDLSAENLSMYQKQWRRMLGGELAKMQALRRLFAKMSDDSLNKILEFALRSDLRHIIEEKGDMDFQGDVISRVIRQPGINRLLFSLGADVLTSILR